MSVQLLQFIEHLLQDIQQLLRWVFLVLQVKKQAAIKFCLKYSGGICLFSYCCIKNIQKYSGLKQ